MEKIILSNKTEINIKPGSFLSRVTVVVSDFTELGAVAEALRTKGNLDTIQFTNDGIVTGEYSDMKLISPLFREVEILEDATVTADFEMREKTELEKRLDEFEASQKVMNSSQQLQGGAIEELGEMISKISEGGIA